MATVLLVAAVAAYLIYAHFSHAPRQDRNKKYNVVIIVSDALRQDVLGCYGGDARTPNIDWLAGNGVLFENSYSTSPWTSPSAVSMFTGNYATTYEYSTEGMHRVETAEPKTGYTEFPRIYVPPKELLFVEVLKELGYAAGMEIENINASMHDNLQGFEYVSQSSASKRTAAGINEITGGALFDSWQNAVGYWHSFYVLRRLMENAHEQRFFLLDWILDPHSPYDPVKKFFSRIDADEQKLPHPKDYYTAKKYDRPRCTEAEQDYIKRLYIAEVESVDERVGFILRVLKHKRMLDRTYIVFTSDHGEQFGEHGLYEHGGHGIGCHYFEGLIRVPLIFSGPGLPAGKRIKDRVTLLSLMPTLRDLLGVEYDDDMQGGSVAPLLLGNSIASEALYFDDIQEHDQVDALVEGNYKLIVTKDGSFELYDTAGDPLEENNIAARSPELVEVMYQTIVRWREENSSRRKRNLAALGDHVNEMSSEEKQKVIEKLRSLGYVE